MKTAVWLIAIAQWWTIGENRYYSWKFNRDDKKRTEAWERVNQLEGILNPWDWHKNDD